MKKFLDGLNTEQQEAVIHGYGSCMVLAGPGTGKTTVITSKIGYMINNRIVEPQNILVVTFSKAAAAEMKNRFMKLNDKNVRGDLVTFGTFHSVFFRILKQYKEYKLENLIEEGQKFIMIKTIVRKLRLEFCEDDEQIGEIINDIGYIASTMTDIDDYKPSSCKPQQLRQIMDTYYSMKQNTGKFDYDDMLIDCYHLLKGNRLVLKALQERFKYILVDEFQDINKLQFETIKLLAAPENNLFVVGDDDQSIYGFRGATPDILLQFEAVYPGCKKIALRENYRTTKGLLDSATAVINNNKNRYEKNLEAVSGQGSMPVLFETEDFEEEAKVIAGKIKKKHQEGLSYSKIAIIYRTNLQSRAIIDAFMDYNIPFVAVDGTASIYNHWIFKDILAYMKLSLRIDDTKEIIRVINKPKRYISRDALEKADRIEGDFLYNLATYTALNNLQINSINEMRESIKRMADMSPNRAIRYIRNIIGYEDYLREYSLSKGINIKGLLEALEEAESSTIPFDTIEQYIAHVAEVAQKLKGQNRYNSTEDRVELLTMHRAKGLEFECVFVSGAVDGLSPYIRDEKEESAVLEEERRLFYVALTRAKKELYISFPKTRYKKSAKPSRFVEELSNKNSAKGSQLSIGQKVYHKIYSEGIISQIDDKKGSTRVKVDFDGSIRELDLTVCLRNDIMRVI